MMSDSNHALSRIVAVVERLRDPQIGCEWDRTQTFATIAPYTIEEAYEVADAIVRSDMPALQEELGDLLFQVVLHARIAEQLGIFDLHAVGSAIADKMERRHPHLFADASERPDWEALKAAERPHDASALDGVALALPALMRAEKLQKRAARTGFDWPNSSGPRAKIDEELGEVDTALTEEHRAEEIGDLLFSVVNYARHMGVDPEVALRTANAKFERRFRLIENSANFADLPMEEKERLWVRAKTLDATVRPPDAT